MTNNGSDPKKVGLEAGHCFLSCDADNELVARMLLLDQENPANRRRHRPRGDFRAYRRGDPHRIGRSENLGTG